MADDDERQVYSELHKVLVDTLNKAQPIDQWGKRGHEFRILREIEEMLMRKHGTQQAAAEAGKEMLRTFWRKRKEGSPYWAEARLTPAGWLQRWDDLVAIESSPHSPSAITRAGTDAVGDLIEAIQVTYERSYNQDMADAIARMLGEAPPRYCSALLDSLVQQFTPTATRPLPDPAAVNVARAALKPVADYRDTPAEMELPTTCPVCSHPIKTFSATEAICLGEYNERLHRKTGCGLEWRRFEDGWRIGYWRSTGHGVRRRSVWTEGAPHDLESEWRSQLKAGAPALDITALIEEGRKVEYARVARLIDEGTATADERLWVENYNKARPRVPGVKHVSEVVEAEANW